MAHLISLSESAQSVSVGALFPLPEWARGARWLFDDYDLMVSSALSLDPGEAIDLLQQFDEGWLDAPDRAQEKFCVSEEISDEMIATGMLEHDFVVQMPPVREYTLRVRIKSIEKATPHVVGPEDIS